jgi:hypothetical protein
MIRFRVLSITDIRIFVGLSAHRTTNRSLTSSVDYQTAQHLGINFSSSRGDTNWMITRRGTGTASVVSTGVPVEINKDYYLILDGRGSGTGTVLRITDEDRNVLFSDSYSGTTTPSTTTALSRTISMRDLSGSGSDGFRFYGHTTSLGY